MVAWLIVEDEQDLHDILLSVFEIGGISGVAFDDGAEAMQWLDQVDNGLETPYPQLALLDIRVPNVSGLDISTRIRQSPYLGHIAIVLMTAYRLTAEQEADTLALAGADGLLYKPLPAMDSLQSILERVLSEANERHAPAKGTSRVLKTARKDKFSA